MWIHPSCGATATRGEHAVFSAKVAMPWFRVFGILMYFIFITIEMKNMRKIKTRCIVLCGALCVASFLLPGTTSGQLRGSGKPLSEVLRIAVDAGIVGFGSDYTKTDENYRFRMFGQIDVHYLLTRSFALGAFAQVGSMAAYYQGVEPSNSFFTTGLAMELRWPVGRGGNAAPYLSFRLGGIFFKPRTSYADADVIGEPQSALVFGGGIGFEYIMRRKIGFRFEIGSQLTSSDELDNLISGPQNDGFSYFSLGVSYYLPLGHMSR
jgi:hypothetical protein